VTDIKPIKVNGVAVREGISRNRIKYTAEALSKFSSTLANKPILKDHDARVDNTIGLVTQSHTVDGGKSVRYEGWVKEDGTNVIERIKDGRIKEVSIGAIAGRLVQESEDSDVMIAEDLHGLELSLTPVPGVMGTSIAQALESMRNGKKVLPICESVALFQEVDEMDDEKDYKCPECGKVMSADKKETHMASHKEEEETLKQKYNHSNEVKQMAEEQVLKEKLATQEAEAVKLREQVAAFQKDKKERAIADYKKLAVDKGVQERDVSALSVEVIELLADELRKVSVDKTRGHVGNSSAVEQYKLTETTAYHNGAAFIGEDGILFERPVEGGKGIAITCDPSKLKAEGARWRMFKHSAPMYGGA